MVALRKILEKLRRYAPAKGNQEKTDRITDVIDIIDTIDIIDSIDIIESENNYIYIGRNVQNICA